MAQQLRKVSDKWIKASVLTGLWAGVEIIAGSFLHNLKIPFSGTFLTLISIILVIGFFQIWPKYGIIWRAGLITALMKSISPLCKQFKSGNNYVHAFIANKIIESSYVSNRTSEITSVFPLYLCAIDQKQGNMYEKVQRIPNLNMDIVSELEEILQMQFVAEKTEGNVCLANNNDELLDEYKVVFAPIDILDYIYAVLHSPTYRDRYKEFLKIDFPRVPYPKDKEIFWQLVKLGSEIRQTHLMESPLLNSFIKDYPFVGDGDNVVEKLDYIDGKVYINSIQYFDGVPQIVWEFFIGGYQPAQKWLKDRRGNKLEYDDIIHYKRIIVALTETERLMMEIDRMWGAL